MMDDSNKNEVDTEAGLELPVLENLAEILTDDERKEELLGEESLKVEFEKAMQNQADERARTPFLAAAQTHAMVWTGFQKSVSDLTSADLKRIIIYLCGYPFYLKDVGSEDPKVVGVAYRASKLIEAKSAMILCKAIEQEARVAQALDEQEALIQPLNLETPQEVTEATATVEIKGE